MEDEMERACSMHGSDEKILLTKPELQRPVGGNGHSWENNIEMGLNEIRSVCGLGSAFSG
jgi:hypothetical protein